MKIKKLIMTSMLMLGFISASAQGQQQEPTVEYDFQPHWYVTIQPLGVMWHRGEVDFSDLLRYNVQAAVGYNFNEWLGARLGVNGWKAKNGLDVSFLKGNMYTWSYIAPKLDLTFNVSNAVAGFNPKRVFNFSIFGGIGANIGWGNDEAGELRTKMLAEYAGVPSYMKGFDYEPFELYWDGSKVNFQAQFGAMADFRLTENVALNLEFGANVLPDNWNSKKAGNAEWYFTALAGVKINLGKNYTERIVEPLKPEIVYVDRDVEKIVEKPVYIEKPIVVEPLRRDIFFTINSYKISAEEMKKVYDIAIYLNQNPNAKVAITGYADKGTGNAKINARLGQQRSKAVNDALQKVCGIDPSRIVTDSKGDTEQPFAENDQNRVSICIAE